MKLSWIKSLGVVVPALGCLSVLALAGCGGSSTSSPFGGGGIAGSGGSGSFTANFSAVSGTNAGTSDFSSNSVGGVVTPPVDPIGSILTLVAGTAAANGTGRSFTLVLADSTLTVGKVYPLSGGSNALVYAEKPSGSSNTDLKSTVSWGSTGGTAVLDSISGKTYKFHVTKVPMGPSDGGPTTPGTGTFTVDGSGTATLP